ncbi:beta-lactamase family protein [Hortaea werneckii]|uniref:Beta-lactamase-related domain-containing protein n=1 Tax=Hortaea werneckii TaxID=91943 RepID=A0A3M7FR96_HORWE|nr:beta-lactamase family protein [Hortaea werneckii]KAI7169727.1 beta-lactamase family protein [Hortaea werneckii]KAI7345158.1 beta-lactamase family protein [Hortaea werneckii]KAI7547350.1 beta-lactamase family protein [Hortaea werneckii]KAI7598509.1 beta-lactamase family protein [Hortaea werneckii]
MTSLEERLANGVKAGKIPHTVVAATNRDGSFTYNHAVGEHDYPNDQPMEEDAMFLLASMTKLLTSIAALQLVEAGLIKLDDDVSKILPEVGEQKILKGFDGDTPILEERKNPLTHLLTHTSGFGYDAADPGLMKYQMSVGKTPGAGSTVEETRSHPLLFEPGTAWMYGCSTDWAGKLVERISGMTLEEFMQENMFRLVGVREITFWPEQNPVLKGKVPQMTTRTSDGNLAPYKEPSINAGKTDCFGGHGAYGTIRNYLKIQHSILANDGKLLKPQTVETMFSPQLSPESAKSLNWFMKDHPMSKFMVGEYNPDVELDWGLAGILFLKDDIGKRKKGTLHWSGMANCFWVIDRDADLAYAFGTQVLPPGDEPTRQMISTFELGIYEKAGVKV